ncbi:MAG: CBS domain-containing protein [Deltaproteobacteria bacterium]|nr:CBS domain-containing protein [Deltaproteobacteria bacterium]
MTKETPRKIMPTHLHVIGPEETLKAAVSLMRDKNISCLPVVRGDVAVGILTERDLVRFILKFGLVFDGYLVRDVMTSRVITVSENEDLYDVYSRMCGNRIRHLVLTDACGKVVGIKTFTDLMISLGREYLAEIKTVGEVMTREIFTAQKETSVREALNLMLGHNISCVPVVENERPVGIITERDLGRLASGGPEVLDQRMKEVMRGPVHGIKESVYAFDAVSLMNDLGVRHLTVTDDSGRFVGLVTQTDMVVALIKRHASLEFLIRKRTRQLTRKSEELEFSNQQLRHLDEIKSAFLSSVSHELRTPLTSLLGFAKITGKTFARHFHPLAQGNEKLMAQGEKILGNLNILVHEGERMTRLINDFLDLTKIEAGRIEWHDKLVQASEFVLHAANSLQAQFEAKEGVELKIRVEENLPAVYVDMDRMLQVMINLLSNAAKFTDRGSVTVEAVNVDNEFVEVRVVDTGPGIPADEVNKIFDKFHQLEKRGQGQKISGTGLGLAICKEIVEHYKGRIWAESVVGRGSSFRFRIPTAGQAVKEMSLKIKTVSSGAGDPQVPIVLAVDDSSAIREYLAQLFSDEGFRIVTVPDGRKALEVAEEVLPQCIVMDLMMPGMDGGETIRHLRDNPVTKDIPVIVLSAYPGRKIQGQDASIPKPVDETLLIQTVRGLIRGGRIQGRKCILVPNYKSGGNMLMISAGKLSFVKPEELKGDLSDRFSGTVFLPGRALGDPGTMRAVSTIDDVLIMIMSDDTDHEQGDQDD